ncbi:MAG: hypothetical protein AAFS07_18870 [Pseudomonadota bacterium]
MPPFQDALAAIMATTPTEHMEIEARVLGPWTEVFDLQWDPSPGAVEETTTVEDTVGSTGVRRRRVLDGERVWRTEYTIKEKKYKRDVDLGQGVRLRVGIATETPAPGGVRCGTPVFHRRKCITRRTHGDYMVEVSRILTRTGARWVPAGTEYEVEFIGDLERALDPGFEADLIARLRRGLVPRAGAQAGAGSDGTADSLARS